MADSTEEEKNFTERSESYFRKLTKKPASATQTCTGTRTHMRARTHIQTHAHIHKDTGKQIQSPFLRAKGNYFNSVQLLKLSEMALGYKMNNF